MREAESVKPLTKLHLMSYKEEWVGQTILGYQNHEVLQKLESMQAGVHVK